MKSEYVFSGRIELGDWGSWTSIKLVQSDGFKVDLVAQIKEVIENYDSKKVSVSYLVSKEEVIPADLEETILKKVLGYVDASFEANHYEYSEWTSGTDYDTTLEIGGHNLYMELTNHRGEYLVLRIKPVAT